MKNDKIDINRNKGKSGDRIQIKTQEKEKEKEKEKVHDNLRNQEEKDELTPPKNYANKTSKINQNNINNKNNKNKKTNKVDSDSDPNLNLNLNLDISKYSDFLEKDFNNSQLLKVSSTFIEQKPFIYRKKPFRSNFIEEEGNRTYECQLNQIKEETEKAKVSIRLKTLEENLKFKYFNKVRKNQEKDIQKYLFEQMEQKKIKDINEKNERFSPDKGDLMPDNEDIDHSNYDRTQNQKRQIYKKQLSNQLEEREIIRKINKTKNELMELKSQNILNKYIKNDEERRIRQEQKQKNEMSALLKKQMDQARRSKNIYEQIISHIPSNITK